jgi:CheY-like chemotaxis protein
MVESRRLVLIDDSELTLAVMSSTLTKAGFEVRAVSSLRRFLNEVLDWMPEMSGAELCTWIKSQVQTAKTPVIICSSASDAELEEIARNVGADGYVSKQDGPEALPAKLHALCTEIVF